MKPSPRLPSLFLILILLSTTFIIPVKATTESSPNTVSSVGTEIDWPSFWQTFKQYAQWNLEWYNGYWWTSVKGDLDVQLSYPQPNTSKINLVFDASHSGDYRLTFAINKVVRNYIKKVDKWQYELTYEDMVIVFDWSDCKDIPGLQFTHGVKDNLFWFRIRRNNVQLGAHVEIDPATVATSATQHAVNYGFQRKGFYAAGLFWAFYSTGTNAGWEFSADGPTWTGAFTSIGACTAGNHFSIRFDGTYVHYVRFASNDLFYRRGVPEDNGTITWSAVEQMVYDGSAGNKYDIPSITVDTNGYAWIGAYNDQSDGDDFPVVLMTNNTDGTWTTDLEYELSAVDDINWRVTVVPLTDGKVYVIYCRTSQLPLGQLYDGDWDAGEENDLADYSINYGQYGEFSAVAIDDNVHFVYTRDVTHQLRHNERVWGVGWDAADVLIQDSVTDWTGPVLSADPSTGTLYCFWTSAATDHVYYKQWDAGWDVAATDWINEEVDNIVTDYLCSSFYMDYGGYIGLLYITKTGSPYNVRFANLTLAVSEEYERAASQAIGVGLATSRLAEFYRATSQAIGTAFEVSGLTGFYRTASQAIGAVFEASRAQVLDKLATLALNIRSEVTGLPPSEDGEGVTTYIGGGITGVIMICLVIIIPIVAYVVKK